MQFRDAASEVVECTEQGRCMMYLGFILISPETFTITFKTKTRAWSLASSLGAYERTCIVIADDGGQRSGCLRMTDSCLILRILGRFGKRNVTPKICPLRPDLEQLQPGGFIGLKFMR